MNFDTKRKLFEAKNNEEIKKRVKTNEIEICY